MSSITSINGVDFYFCPLSKIAFQVFDISTVKMIESKNYVDDEEPELVDILEVKLKNGDYLFLADRRLSEVKVSHGVYMKPHCAPDLFSLIAATFKFEYRKFGYED